MSRPSTPRKRSPKTNTFQQIQFDVQTLEERRMMAGDVSVSVVNGDLVINGDREDNSVVVDRVNNDYLINGMNGTTVNGESSMRLSGVNDDIRINMKSGNDRVMFRGGQVEGDVRMIMGAGNDQVLMHGTSVKGRTNIVGGGGDDKVMVVGSELRGRMLINTAAGSDEVALMVSTAVEADVVTGGGQDQVVVKDVAAGHKSSVRAGSAKFNFDAFGQRPEDYSTGVYVGIQGGASYSYGRGTDGNLYGKAQGQFFAGAEAQWGFNTNLGAFNIRGQAEAFVGVKADGKATFTTINGGEWGQHEASLEGNVFAGAEARADGAISVRGNSVSGMVEAQAGAGAWAGASSRWDGRNVSGSAKAGAFAGARVGAEGDIVVANGAASIGGGVGARAGVGADFQVGGAFGADEVGVEAEIGAALGLGADVSIDVSVNPTQIGNELENTGRQIGNTATNVGNEIGNTATNVGNELENAGRTVVNVFNPTNWW